MERAPKTSGKALSWMGSKGTPMTISLPRVRGRRRAVHGTAAGAVARIAWAPPNFWSAAAGSSTAVSI